MMSKTRKALVIVFLVLGSLLIFLSFFTKLEHWSNGVYCTLALGGFLFGFDTIVISGADQPIQKLWNTSPLFHGTFIMSMALWGTVLGALLGGIPCNVLGRKKTLFWIGVLYEFAKLLVLLLQFGNLLL